MQSAVGEKQSAAMENLWSGPWLVFLLASLSFKLHFRCFLLSAASQVSLAGKPDESSEQPVSSKHEEKVSSRLYMSRLSTGSTKPQCLIFSQMYFKNCTSLYRSSEVSLRQVLGQRLFVGLHLAFYELWKDIKAADTSIWWCQLSVAIIELLHLSQDTAEAWPQATGGSGEPAPTRLIVEYNMIVELTPVEQSYWMKPLDFDSVTFNSPSHILNGPQLNQR